MHLRKAVSAIKERVLPTRLKLVKVEFMGKSLTAYSGTIKTGDVDDAWLYALSQYHHSIYDVGANLGFTAILASINDPGKKIVLVDPNPNALNCAAGSLIRSNMSANKMFITAFLSDKLGEQVKFYAMGIAPAGSMFAGASESASMTDQYYMVDTMTMDQLWHTTGIIPDFVKIDVEGAESLVMNGAKELAAQKQTKFFLEMHAPPELPMKENATRILNWCNEAGYDAWYLKHHELLTSADTIAHRGRCHLLLMPKGTDYPEYLKNIAQGADLKEVGHIGRS